MLGIFAAKPGHQLADAKEIRRLVADLPAQEPAVALESAGVRLDSVAATDELRLDQRLEIVLQIDAAVVAQTHRLGREYLTTPDLSRARESKLWAQNRDYWLRLAAAYEDILRRYQGGDKGADALTSRLPQLCARLLRALGGWLKWAQFRYGPVGGDTWASAGAAYQAAAALHAERKAVAFGANAAASSVEAEYLKLLLFQASSMDNLLPVEIEIAERLIAHLVPFFKLTDHVHPFNVYWVDPNKAVAPTRLAKMPEITPTLRFFATRTGVDALNGLRLKIESTEALPSDVNFGGQYAPRTVLPVCGHLADCWAPVPPMRSHQRHRVKSWLTVINGIERIFRRLSGQDTAATDEAWVAEDVSLNGIGANVTLIGKDWLKVGALVGMQPEGGGNWLVGVVRRLTRESESIASVGLETLSKSARAAVVDSAGLRIEAIVLDRLAAGAEVRVVVAGSVWDARIPLTLALDGVRASLHPMGLMETGAGYAIGLYRVQLT